jgi:hypothetical protein
MKLRLRDALILPYISLFEELRVALPIESIIVGPRPVQDKQADAIKIGLDATPFANVEIRLSEIPYRQ